MAPALNASTRAATAQDVPVESRLRTRDGGLLFARHWAPAGQARATIALVHGLAEHSGRYDALGRRLNRSGIGLWAVDLRGHGLSAGRRVWVERFDEYLLDTDAMLDARFETHGAEHAVPVFLMGHSMGGAVAALYATEQLKPGGRALAGLILSSPALALGDDVPRWMITMGHFLGRFLPRVPVRKIDARLLARDPAVVADNLADPLVHHGAIPARTGAQMLDAMARIRAGRVGLRLPILVFHGTLDKLTEPNGSREFVAACGASDRTLKLYEGNYHETMNDLDREQVIDALIEWVLARTGTSG